MNNEKVYGMLFTKVYPMLYAKTERKGYTKDDVDELACWLTGYSKKDIEILLDSEITYGNFFLQAPMLNPDRKKITGAICGIRVENIEELLMQEIRYLDKIIDELVKGKSLDKIKRITV